MSPSGPRGVSPIQIPGYTPMPATVVFVGERRDIWTENGFGKVSTLYSFKKQFNRFCDSVLLFLSCTPLVIILPIRHTGRHL